MKHYILGTDEAGYGPNLGPLVVSCVVWEMTVDETPCSQPFDDQLAELERRLGPIVTDTPSQLGKNGKVFLIGDSKKLYQTGKLHVLIDSVLIAIHLCGQKSENLSEILLPFDTNRHRLAADQVKEALTSLGVILCDMNASVISARDFNRQLEILGNKSMLLSNMTLELIKNAVQTLPDNGDVTILCDKHGGRNRYADLLYQFFPDCWIEILTEGTPLSVYQLEMQGHKTEFRFQAKADRHIPAALASMTAKLLRELAMREFNHFWQQYVPDLQPTAGYPVDALRFFGQIDETRQKLGIPKSVVWREK